MVCSPLHYPVNLGQPCELPLKPPRPDKRGSDRKNQSFRTGPGVVRNVIIKAIEQMMRVGSLLSTPSKWEHNMCLFHTTHQNRISSNLMRIHWDHRGSSGSNK